MKLESIYNLKVFVVPIVFALFYRYTFAIESMETLYSVMTLSFFILIPFGIGFLTVLLSKLKWVKNVWYRIFAPWLTVLLFLILTIAINLEGFACWIMITPFFLGFATLGGFFGGYIRLRNNKKSNIVQISFVLLLPLIITPLENSIKKIPGTYETYTYIDINAPKNKIWDNVTRVPEIPANQDSGNLTRFLGFPRPLRAELNYNGIGATREAIFSKGLIFHEKVLDYTEMQQMHFSIKANPHEIPSTTMDNHIVVGGDYFDVLDGTYKLEQLSSNHYRLHLYSHFKLSTTFNFYAGIWAKWIMKDIQNNILGVIKARAES